MEIVTDLVVTTGGVAPTHCPYCSGQFNLVYHSGPCPSVAAIEYYPDGAIKRIEFRER